jgi:hypothetical protein
MNHKHLFSSQNLLDVLIEEGRIKIDHNIMTSLTKEQHSFALEPAYGIVRTTAGSADPHKLVGTIKMDSERKDLNAEVYRDSIIGDAAYESDPGFLGDEERRYGEAFGQRAAYPSFAGEPPLAQ